MAYTSGDDARHLQKLATLVTQRRVVLGYRSKEAAADACGISHTTYRKIEGGRDIAPQRVRESTYAKLEMGFKFRAGSCKAVIEGEADSITLEDGTELIEGAQIAHFAPEALSEGIPDAVAKSAMTVAPELTGRQIQAMGERVMEELRRRGLLP
jgi:hypothetical protein